MCLIIIDYQTFRSVVTQVFIKKSFGREALKSLIQRLIFDLAEITWVPLDEIKSEDESKLLEIDDSLNSFLGENFNYLIEKYELFLKTEALLSVSSHYQLTHDYTSNAPVEFRLREYYQSQPPFLSWVLENTLESREKNHLRELIESIQRKYLLDS